MFKFIRTYYEFISTSGRPSKLRCTWNLPSQGKRDLTADRRSSACQRVLPGGAPGAPGLPRSHRPSDVTVTSGHCLPSMLRYKSNSGWELRALEQGPRQRCGVTVALPQAPAADAGPRCKCVEDPESKKCENCWPKACGF